MNKQLTRSPREDCKSCERPAKTVRDSLRAEEAGKRMSPEKDLGGNLGGTGHAQGIV